MYRANGWYLLYEQWARPSSYLNLEASVTSCNVIIIDLECNNSTVNVIKSMKVIMTKMMMNMINGNDDDE